ncbi:DUF3893 domain-containing protein [Nocardia cyriacigeorgica]|uniref:DUF3893 domain-containing protein n=1 Tax=Nocardia cyriacigeorgica TaxID=135487 RepID=A0A5R8P550_9NOCA|nr:DUF3962 domain-containing protein [Nocardia cyriacigeorgica]TLF92923.1 DUF3893 domain-containing protein [Nocardia cyriacigeorgica]
MTTTTAIQRPALPKETITFTAFEFTSTDLTLSLHSAAFPTRWTRILREQWYIDPAHRGRNLPTYALIELIASLDAHIVAVARDLDDPHWLRAHREVDSEVLKVAVAAWASTEITPRQPELDWEAMLAGDEFEWHPETVNLAEWGTRPNGTSDVASHCYQVLPGYLAGLVVSHGITIQDKKRTFILGPLRSDGVRSAVSWPPESMAGPTGDALWSYQITFQLETIPTRPTPVVLADLSVVRYAYLPMRYVPKAPRRGKSISIWMYASKGFLRSPERPTIVEATAKRRKIDGEWRWHWDAGLSRALARLTTRRVPDPDQVIMEPGMATSRSTDDGIVALAVYQNGMMMQRPEEPTKPNDNRQRSKSIRHPVATGFQPVDHVQVHQELEHLVVQASLTTVPSLTPYKAKHVDRRLPRRQPQDAHYELELWTQNSDTREAVLTAISHESGLGLTPIDNPDPATFQFGGNYTLTVSTQSIGRLASGIDVPTATDDAETTAKEAERRRARDQRITEIVETLPPRAIPTAAVVEIDTPDLFSRIDKLDPKNQIKAGFATARRTPNCLNPIETRQHADEEAANANQNVKAKKRAQRADGTLFRAGDIKRAAAAVLDSLRQAGRTTLLPEPPGIPGSCEIIGVWLEKHGGTQIPIIIRHTTDGQVQAQLFGSGSLRTLAYPELPAALVAGEGRLSRTYTEARQQLIDVLVGAIDPGATHDRVLLVRAGNLRNRGWAWLQDQHITPQRLHLPGVDPADEESIVLKPTDLPGLRVVRLRERSSAGEVPRAFVSYTELDDTGTETEKYARASGLYPLNDNVYYGIAPRADQQQTPLAATKLDPDRPGAARVLGWNPNPLEIIPAFTQEHDDPPELAAYVNHLRRAHLHTTITTQMPLPLHLASLADEYLKCLG